MNEYIKTAILAAQKDGTRVFFYSAQQYPDSHNAIEICLECDVILVPEKLRDELNLADKPAVVA